MTPFILLYGRPSRTPLSWEKLEARVLIAHEVIQENMKIIWKKLKESQEREKKVISMCIK